MTSKVIISGASSGIGRALAFEYSKRGATLALISRRKKELLDLQKKLTCACFIYDMDVNDINACQKMANHFIKQVGTPDIIIANAGISHGTLSEHYDDLITFQKIVGTNLFGVLNLFQPFIKIFQSKKAGSLVGISSVAGIRGLPGASAYSSSKSALTNYLEALRVELSEYNINVTNISPGYIKSPMTAVNQYPMPFIMDVEKAAKKIIKAIDTKRKFIIIPWQMALIGKIMHFLPIFLWDWFAKRGPKKPRKIQD